MTRTSKITFAAASLAALLAAPAFAAPAQTEASRVSQAWTIVNERHEVNGEAGETVGPVFQSEVNQLLRSGQSLDSNAVQVLPVETSRSFRNQPRAIEATGEFGG